MVPEHPLTHAILGALADGEEHFIRDLAATLDVSAKKIADSGGHLVRNGYATRGLGIYRATEGASLSRLAARRPAQLIRYALSSTVARNLTRRCA
ncbi:MAG: hypothetical protein ACLU6O_07825 [Bilophila wadsworthia]